jgi:8-oxo-dGTP diphosphatase
MAHIRVAVDAVIIEHGAILLIEYDDARFGRHLGLPGGGVEPNEPIPVAVCREVREETGADVIVGPLLLVNEYHPERDGATYDNGHEVRLVFRCMLRSGSDLGVPEQPDPDQIGVCWLPIEALPTAALLPKIGMRLFHLIRSHPEQNIFNTDL